MRATGKMSRNVLPALPVYRPSQLSQIVDK